MRVALLTYNLIPYPTGFGTAIHGYSLIKTLLTRGHEVHLCCYGFDPKAGKAHWSDGNFQKVLDELTRMGIKVHISPSFLPAAKSAWENRLKLLKKLAVPQVSDFYVGPQYREWVTQIIDQIQPDALCVWTVDAMAAAANLRFLPKLASLTDLDHLVQRYRRKFRPGKSFDGKFYQWVDAVAERKLPRLITDLLSECEIVFDHANHHADWLRHNGVPQAVYLPVPVLDQAGTTWRGRRKSLLADNKIKRITLIGNVTGIATLPGLYLLANEIIPELEKELLNEEFEIHIIGGGKLDSKLGNLLHKPYVKLRGYVEDIQSEFESSHVFLVPTPINLGFRTRISEAFSFGCCVVAHQANASGMPELVDGKNVLLASNGKGLAEAVNKCLRSEELRKNLGNSARLTFEQELDGERVCSKMIEELERIVV